MKIGKRANTKLEIMSIFPPKKFRQIIAGYTGKIYESSLDQWGDNFKRIYIPLTLPLKECIQVRTKLSEGQLFTFRDRQDSCLPSAARLDSPEDQGKGKVGPRKVLFLQEYNFLQG